MDDTFRQHPRPSKSTPQFTENDSTMDDSTMDDASLQTMQQTTGRAQSYSGVPEL